jgi:type I restriction enzyme S subunit
MRSSFAATPLASIAHIEMGQSPDSSTVKEGDHCGVPFLQGNGEFGDTHPAPRFSCTAPMKMCRVGDILISVRAPVGAMNIADRDYCIGRGLAAVRVAGMSATLAAHLVSAAAPALRRVAQGTTFEAISKTDLASLVVMAPPQADREPLGRVLDTLDTTIRQTEATMEKLKQVKQGLMHDLLTRGIDTNGALRPPQSQAPHRYKDSPLGWIPREWEARVLNDLVDQRRPIVYGILMPGQGHEGGVPVVKVKDIMGGSILLDQLLLTSPALDLEYKRSRLKAGDLLFTIRGSVGRTAFVPAQLEDANITQDTARIGISGVDARFVREYLAMLLPVRFIATHTLGVAVQGINLRDVRRIPIAVPRPDEATAIADILNTANIRISAEALNFQKLKLQKSGLMDDLLTGRVRVTPLLAESTAA